MIERPVRHRRAAWVVRGAGRGGAPSLRRSRYAQVRLREVEGLLLGPAEVSEVYGPAPTAYLLEELLDTTGEWVGLLGDDAGRTWVAMSDFHGFGHLFWVVRPAEDGQDVYLGTTLDAVVDRLRADGHRLEVDWAVAHTTLASNHVLLRNQWSRRTLVEGVRCLRPDELLVVDHRGVGTVPRPMTTDPQGRSYDELLDAGVERAAGLLTQVADAVPDVRVFASGGKDSRVVLSLLDHAGVLGHASFVAADPSRWADAAGRKELWRDLVVSDELRTAAGRPWYVEPDYEDRMLSFAESIAHHQSFYAGSQWAASAERQLRWPTVPYVAVRGGAGELMRTAYRAIRTGRPFSVMEQQPASLPADLRRLHGLVVHGGVTLPDAARAAGEEAVAEAFSLLPDAPVGEQVDAHYRLHRNRSHFGHVLHSAHRRSLALHPLATPEFLRAAQLLPFAERDLGLAAFDVIERLRPDLNRHRLASGSWPAQVWERRGGAPSPLPQAPRGPFGRERVPSYFDAEDHNHFRRGWTSGPLRFDIRTAAQTRAVRDLWRLHELAPEQAPAGLVADLADLVSRNALNPATTVVRLASVLRALDGPVTDPPAGLEVRVSPGRGLPWARRVAPAPVRTGPPGSVRDLRGYAESAPSAGLETFEVDPRTEPGIYCHLELSGGELLARRVGAERAGWRLEHTFTLVRGKEEVAGTTTTDSQVSFGAPGGPGPHRVLLTARCLDRPEVVVRATSPQVVVPVPGQDAEDGAAS
ncbi:hypothetical protein SGUI_0864 [Serinicoccus hydrothermalis]|uniref:Asparagine synthetase domain-containing protein n=1 Tax=Serinicoccus hydrothermalis TaxID=1758689 RepID=A0A1B1N9Y3_9MICO|nr:hypothetical protein [Serinicoccus hydrothermalis]ANS78260.1 hypothetical protein SGUI_0864 [Serinicoccus hydrothermalis]